MNNIDEEKLERKVSKFRKKKYHQGIFKPKHPEKYLGNPNNIIFRSGLEKRIYHYIDDHPNILKWGSEEFCIEYFYEVDKRVHRYFPDLCILYRNRLGEVKKAVIEIKPSAFCKPPKRPRRITKGYENILKEWIKNSNKWAAAEIFCKKHNMDFLKLTEKSLNNSSF